MSDHEDHTTDERPPETSTDDAAQNMPSANAFAHMFKAAMAPVLSQLTSLNENVSSMLLHGHDDSDEDGETASNDEPSKSADMDADLSALLASVGKDANNEAMPGELTLKCKLKCYFKAMNNPLGVSPSKGKQGTTRGKEKIF